MNNRQLTGMLVKRGILSLPELKSLEEKSLESGQGLRDLLFKEARIDETQLVDMLSEQYNVPKISVADLEIEAEVISILNKQTCLRYKVVPISRIGNTLTVAMSDPSNMNAQDDIKFLTDYNVEVVVASESEIIEAIEKYYGAIEAPQSSSDGGGDAVFNLDELLSEMEEVQVETGEMKEMTIEESIREAGDAPVVKLVNMIVLDAIKKKASDIHVEPYEKSFRIRFRIDGVLYDVLHPPKHMQDAIVARFKVMSNLDIAEKRVPQDGRIKIKMGKGREMDFRVSVLPCIFGEKTVLRLLDKSNLQLDMTKLGFFEEQLEGFKNAIHRPYGMILVTGPTGSGKTTTLYSALAELNKTDVNISTAEDPVEFNLEGINQVPIREQVGLTFSAALRSCLRQDPDIIMVGEIRDFETAEIAVKAALTGHLVMSTLHTNDAPSTITRLLNMGIESFLVTSSLNVIAAQRLGRKVCQKCKEEIPIEKSVLKELQVTDQMIAEVSGGVPRIFKGRGCDACSGSGYKGRIAFYEVLLMSDVMKEAVLNGASSMELKQTALQDGMKSMRMCANLHMLAGVTSMDEVLRNTAPD
ncbi:MAG TPA: type IV-A pilus assembly ATPase PilB [bacterium]|nr:type IV-A pilus assembly ATPase PilB [bacterium]